MYFYNDYMYILNSKFPRGIYLPVGQNIMDVQLTTYIANLNMINKQTNKFIHKLE